jgi:uncharacterized protein (DUF924 family)
MERPPSPFKAIQRRAAGISGKSVMCAKSIPEIVQFWLGESLEDPRTAFARRDWWYRGGPAVDEEIGTRFGALVRHACASALADWRTTPDGALALILLLDQFTRNLYRHTAQAYRGDARAFEVVTGAIDLGLDAALHPVARIWLYHPFHHSEEIAQQDRGMALLDGLATTASDDWRPYIQRSVEGWRRHRDIVARFGRFPHRNRVLGRTSTDDERRFLATDYESFGQGPK